MKLGRIEQNMGDFLFLFGHSEMPYNSIVNQLVFICIGKKHTDVFQVGFYLILEHLGSLNLWNL